MAKVNKHFKVVPKANVVPAVAVCKDGETGADLVGDVISVFAFNMNPDMNNYFEVVEITEEEYNELKEYALDEIRITDR